MNTYLKQRIEALLACSDSAILATCGQAGPQISRVPYKVCGLNLLLSLSQGSDHLFNLETQSQLVLLAPKWKLQGTGIIMDDANAAQSWKITIRVEPARLHILAEDGQNPVETIDL